MIRRCVVCVALVSVCGSTGQAREWTDQSGRKTEARFVRLTGDTVIMMRGTRTIRVPLSNLSDNDQKYVREQAGKPASGTATSAPPGETAPSAPAAAETPPAGAAPAAPLVPSAPPPLSAPTGSGAPAADPKFPPPAARANGGANNAALPPTTAPPGVFAPLGSPHLGANPPRGNPGLPTPGAGFPDLPPLPGNFIPPGIAPPEGGFPGRSLPGTNPTGAGVPGMPGRGPPDAAGGGVSAPLPSVGPTFPSIPNPPSAGSERTAYNCTNCNKEVSAEATKCPHCGAIFEFTENPNGTRTYHSGGGSWHVGRGIFKLIGLAVIGIIGVIAALVKMFTGRTES